MSSVPRGLREGNLASPARREPVDVASPPEVSIVMPCLNEAETLATCISKAQHALRANGIAGEIIVADNGSTDGSAALAAALGARVVHVKVKGYGSALRGGIAAASGAYIIMVDADDSYDFEQISPFVEKLREGCELVTGNRFQGSIKPGAMRPMHRHFGVPILTWIARMLFGSPFRDNHCGLRAFTRSAYDRISPRALGWEFGSEINLKANLLGLRVAEVPITLSPDGRTRPPHLRTWQAGWQHLRLMLMYAPRWLFLYPGALLMALGALLGLWLMPGPRKVGEVTINVHTLLYAATAILLGFQSIAYWTFTKVFAAHEEFMPETPRIKKILGALTLERGLALGGSLMIAGLGASAYAVWTWGATHFGPLDASRAMRIIIPAVLSMTIGLQTVLSSFFLSILEMGRKK